MPHRIKPSRLLARLDAEIAGARHALAADCKQAEKAGYLARLGHIDDAKAIVAALHQRYDKRPHMELSIWVNLAEGLISHFSDMDPAAHDKIMRAHALSVAADIRPMMALTSAWLAHMEYARLRIKEMSRQLASALQLADVKGYAARARVSLVIAQSLHLAGRYDIARLWYERARTNVLPDGDVATTSAIIHNMAWLHMALLRQSVLAGAPNVVGMENALIGAESNQRFDALMGVSTLPALEPILRAQIHSLQGNVAEASKLYSESMNAMYFRGAFRLHGYLIADRAWCRARLGMLDGAREDAQLAVAALMEETQVDDCAATHSLLQRVFSILGEPVQAANHAALALPLWKEFESLQTYVVATLVPLDRHW